MTPLYNKLTRYLSPAASSVLLAIIYAALLVLIAMFLGSRATFDLIYLDLGR